MDVDDFELTPEESVALDVLVASDVGGDGVGATNAGAEGGTTDLRKRVGDFVPSIFAKRAKQVSAFGGLARAAAPGGANLQG